MNKYKVFSLLVLSLFVISGCQEEGPVENQKNSNASITIQEDPAPTNEPAADYSEADQTAYKGALDLMDKTFCEKIKETELKTQCEIEVTDLSYKKEALDQTNPELCNKISTEDKKASCKIEVEILKNQLNQKEAEKADLATYNNIMEKGDFQNCSSILDPNSRALCENNKIVYEALSNNDIAMCERLPEQALIEECKVVFESNIPAN